jgi:hypothetical protein
MPVDYHGDIAETEAAELHPPFVVSESDPGAIGAGKGWFKRSTLQAWIRNAADDGWDPFILLIGGAAPSDGDVLTWNDGAGYWEASAPTGGGGGGEGADVPPVSPDAFDDEFDSDTGPDGSADWAWLNQGDASYAVSHGALHLVGPHNAGPQVRALRKAAPGGSTWKIRAKMIVNSPIHPDYKFAGIGVYDSSGGKLESIGIGWAGTTLKCNRWNSVTSWVNAPSDLSVTAPVMGHSGGPIYLEIEKTSTELIYRYSHFGADETFTTIYTSTIASHQSAITDVVLMVHVQGGAFPVRVSFPWIRKVA